MLYLIGGPPRCGKSELALRLGRTHGLPFLSTDVMWGVLEEAFPAWRTPMRKGPERIPTAAEMFKPYLARLCGLLQSAATDFVVEGELIIPSDHPFTLRLVPLALGLPRPQSHAPSRSCWTRPETIPGCREHHLSSWRSPDLGSLASGQ